jgi:hypothetical protein
MQSLLSTVLIWIFAQCAAAVGPTGQDGQSKSMVRRSKMAVSLHIQQKLVEGRLRVLVSFEFKNTGKKRLRLERWLALQPPGVPPAVLQVFDRNGDPIGYLGPFIYRMEPRRADFLVFKPGESRRVSDVDVTDHYNWPSEAQRMTVRYEVFSSSESDLELVESDRIEFDYQPVVPCPWVPRDKLPKNPSVDP